MERLTRSDPILAASDPSSAIRANRSVSMMVMEERRGGAKATSRASGIYEPRLGRAS
jgi:hypothetical protein